VALIATPRASNANSYLTVAEADDMAAERLYTSAWDDSLEQEAALIQATYRLEQYDYVGITADEYLETEAPTQALKWPRVLNDDGDLIRNYGGIKQVETATIVGTITGDGDASVTVTAAGMTGSPKTLLVPVLNGDTASVVAGKIRTALSADVDVIALFTVGGTGAAVSLTKLIAADNDSTLNIAYTNGTCTGLTPNATSANTVEGALYAIPLPIKQATFEVALSMLAAGGEAVAAGAVSSLKIGSSVEVKYAESSSGEAVDTSADDTGLPIQAARFLKGLRLIPALA
jgi:hypothetical protein